MNKNYTLKKLGDIGSKAAFYQIPGTRMSLLDDGDENHQEAREAFAKAILDAIGYELPKDEEREALRQALAKNEEEPTQDPAWIYWDGGKCPLSANVKRWEVKYRDGSNGHFSAAFKPPARCWIHEGECGDIIAYRAWE